MKKIGLVIQGPLLSVGRSGKKLHQSVEQMKKGGLIEFDCRPNIERIIKEYRHLFDCIVVSTWDNEVQEGDGWEGAKLISVPDPGGITQPDHYKDNNKFRQFLSTLNGLLELEREGIEFAVKTRTDTYLDFEKLVREFSQSYKRQNNHRAIYATILNKKTFLLHDLYFASATSAMKEFCQAVLSHDRFEFIASVHREMILKHAYENYREEIGVQDWAYFPWFPPDGVSRETRKIFDYMLDQVFFTLDPEIFRRLLWRGEPFDKEHIDGLMEDVRTRRIDLPELISTDWDRYYVFRKRISGEEPKTMELFKAHIGGLGWRAWNWLRKVARTMRIK